MKITKTNHKKQQNDNDNINDIGNNRIKMRFS